INRVGVPGMKQPGGVKKTQRPVNIADLKVRIALFKIGGEILLQEAPGFGRGPGLCVAIELPGGALEG
ncbi:MAG: hypothetical protein ACPHXW_00130, partial [Marinobacterium sp.]